MIERLKTLKEKSHMTNQQIAEKSGIPESTIARIFSGKTLNPTIVTVISMVKAMGGTADDLFDSTIRMELDSKTVKPDVKPSDEIAESKKSGDASLSKIDIDKYFLEMLSAYQNEILKKDAWIKRLFWCLISLIFIILAVLIIDLANPAFGFVRHD